MAIVIVIVTKIGIVLGVVNSTSRSLLNGCTGLDTALYKAALMTMGLVWEPCLFLSSFLPTLSLLMILLLMSAVHSVTTTSIAVTAIMHETATTRW